MKGFKIALHWQMAIALILGAICGFAFCGCYREWSIVINGIRNIFINAINMIVVPLVFISTVLSISSIGNSKSMGRVAAKSFLYFVITSIFAAVVGVTVTDLLRPGYNAKTIEIDASNILDSAKGYESLTMMDKIVSIVPDNIFKAFTSGSILPIIFFALLFGYFVTKINPSRQNVINNIFESFNDVIMSITNFIIRFAPVGIFAIVMALVGNQASDIAALKDCLKNIAFFVIVVWISLIIMGGVILPIIVGVVAKVSPLKHLKQIYSALMVAFSTSSSYSALPLIISDAKEKLGVSNGIASFTVPLGITFNKIGTVIYECVAVIFVAQAVGIDLTAAQQVSLIGASIVTVFGAPSVPLAGVITLAILLKAMDLPTDFIGMFMAVDILCDMPKTLLNAYSVSCSAIVVARSEGEDLKL
jgi:Na+/H+-dicarboxylate symporter